MFKNRISYWNRIAKAYLSKNASQLSFWHGTPEKNIVTNFNNPISYYMKFHYKANYNECFDEKGIPLLNYHGNIGIQYNPIAISQYGLGNYNLFVDSNDKKRLDSFLKVSDWLVSNLELNNFNIPVWNHKFNFEYRDTLIAPWYSGLAQGLGISVLVRAFSETGNIKYRDAYEKSWISFEKEVKDGGVIFIDSKNNYWIEEYIVNPPTHILNGFLWSLWGVFDSWKIMGNKKAKDLFFKCIKTLEDNLSMYDNGYWSLYEKSNTLLPMLASPFYHKLHIVQLEIMHEMTSASFFQTYEKRWKKFESSKKNRTRALIGKSLFKILYY